jgi:hypothetical protein
MSFPDLLQNRAARMIADAHKMAKNAHQRLNTIGSQVSALQPGDWQPVTLAGSWTNMAGYIPAQAQIQRAGLALVIGHIQGGSTADGTLIGTLAAGYFNPVHKHSFTATVIAGAATVNVAGGIAGSSDSSGVIDGTTQGTSGAVSGSGVHSHGPGSYSLSNGHHQHTATSMSSQTPINYNTVTLTIGTDGSIVLTNCNPNVTQLSFNEPLPLVTS